MRFLRKRLFKKLKDIKFSKTPYLLSEETIKEYDYVKGLFTNSIEILKKYPIEDDYNSLNALKELLTFYEKSDTLVLSLINEMFKTRFIETVEKRLSLFELLNKLFRMFYLFDNYRNKYVNVFHAFSIFKLNERSKLEEKDNLRYSTFCCLGMPMARLFVSYFTADGFEVYHPVILKKRATIFLNDTKKDYLLFLNTLIVENTDLKYVKMFLCALYEKIQAKDPFVDFFENLKKSEKNYYIDMVNLL